MSDILDFLKSAAPAIATALGGPLAGIATQFIASKLGVDPSAVQQTLAGMTAADMVKMKELDLDFQKHLSDNGIALQLAQIGVNTEEAKSLNWWVAGWRPCVGWVGAAALCYAAIIEPLARFAARVAFGYAGAFPAIDTTLTLQVLLGILGLGALRTTEKAKRVASEH